MKSYFEHLERIRKATMALRIQESTIPTDSTKIQEARSFVHALLDDYSRRWPEPIDGACSCSVEGSEGCRPKSCPNSECDTVIEGSDFCSPECAEEWTAQMGHEPAPMEVGGSIHEAADRLNRRLKGEPDGDR